MTARGQRRAAAAGDTDVPARLVASAARVIAADGTAGATSRAITNDAGENLAAITYYFGSKDALVTEALVRQAHALIEPVVVELTSDRPQVEKLLAAVQLLESLFARHRHELPTYLECLAAAPRNETVAVAVRELTRRLRATLAAEMTTQQEAGLIPVWVRPAAMAELIVALVQGVVVGAVTDPDDTHPTAVGQQFVALLLAVAGAARSS
jgi:AcrR family transcriptional regulator